ncbi:MAG: hypothetical protein ACRDYA_02425 [Egibacteraceae bacterium]
MESRYYNWKRLGTVREAVMTVIGDFYGLYGRILLPETDLAADLGSDEVDDLELLMTIEELFEIRFDKASRAAVATVGDVIDLVETALRATAPASHDAQDISNEFPA